MLGNRVWATFTFYLYFQRRQLSDRQITADVSLSVRDSEVLNIL